MPIYEYRCTRCGRQFEVIQKFSDRPLRTCSECSGKLEKLISKSAFQLRGGGWFASDYSKSSGKTSSSPDKADKTAKPSGSGSDSKAS